MGNKNNTNKNEIKEEESKTFGEEYYFDIPNIDESKLKNEYKIIFIGESGVGAKTSLINRIAGLKFNPHSETTTTNSFVNIKIKLGKNREINLHLWDTIGQEKFRQLTKMFFNGAKIVLFVYDVTNKESFEALPNWIKDVDEQIGPNYIRGVIANKIDLIYNEEVNQEEGKEFANSIKAKFLMTSAKTESPKKFEKLLIELVKEYISKEGENSEKHFSLSSKAINEKNGHKNCCK